MKEYALKVCTINKETHAVTRYVELARVTVQPLAQIRSDANREDAMAVTRCFETAIKELHDEYEYPEFDDALLNGIKNFLECAIGPDAMTVADCVLDFHVELPETISTRYRRFISFYSVIND